MGGAAGFRPVVIMFSFSLLLLFIRDNEQKYEYGQGCVEPDSDES